MLGGDKGLLEKEYKLRFDSIVEYRNKLWKILTTVFFQSLIPKKVAILDLGVGYGEFINTVTASKKYAMDLNPGVKNLLHSDITFINQNCAEKWDIPENYLDVIFSSNFLEHLQSKA